MTSADDAVMSAAREIRPFLNDLVGARAKSVDAALASILMSRDDDMSRVEALSGVFADSSELTDWIGQYVYNEMIPPEVVGRVSRGAGPGSGGYAGLPGDPAPVPGTRFTCPDGRDYTRYLLRSGETLESCPTHHCALVRAD
jgi:hypothetical protein